MTVTFDDVRPLFASFGADLARQDRDRWTGPFDLPDPVAQLYRELGPLDVDVPAYGNDVLLPSLALLWDLQAGYRWDATTGDPSLAWPDELLVVAQQGGDPIAVDRSTGSVQFALAGAGTWRFEPLADAVTDAVYGLGLLGSIVEHADELCDEDSLILPQHVDRAERALSDALGSEPARRILRWADWLPT